MKLIILGDRQPGVVDQLAAIVGRHTADHKHGHIHNGFEDAVRNVCQLSRSSTDVA